jgi:hypothetical protein
MEPTDKNDAEMKVYPEKSFGISIEVQCRAIA